MLPIGLCAQLACVWEVTARKVGNVHRLCDFDDSSYLDYLASAAAIAPVLESAWKRRVGDTVLACVLATRQVCTINTNLGMILLLAPLATVAGEPLRTGLPQVLERLDVEDSRMVYEAIRIARPAGLGKVEDQDVGTAPTLSLRQVMSLAAGRDLVARQYHNSYFEIFDEAAPALRRALDSGTNLEEAIIRAHLELLARYPDSLIARKRGLQEAQLASEKARQVLEGTLDRREFDAWLREEGHARNPGTTADLIAAGLFVGLREGWLSPLQRFASPLAV